MPPESNPSPNVLPKLARSAMPAAAEQPTKRSPAQIKADQLFQGQQEILIEHKGETYQLRITRNDKLILTK